MSNIEPSIAYKELAEDAGSLMERLLPFDAVDSRMRLQNAVAFNVTPLALLLTSLPGVSPESRDRYLDAIENIVGLQGGKSEDWPKDETSDGPTDKDMWMVLSGMGVSAPSLDIGLGGYTLGPPPKCGELRLFANMIERNEERSIRLLEMSFEDGGIKPATLEEVVAVNAIRSIIDVARRAVASV